MMRDLRGHSYIARYILGQRGGQPFYRTATAGKGKGGWGVQQDKERANLKVTWGQKYNENICVQISQLIRLG